MQTMKLSVIQDSLLTLTHRSRAFGRVSVHKVIGGYLITIEGEQRVYANRFEAATAIHNGSHNSDGMKI